MRHRHFKPIVEALKPGICAIRAGQGRYGERMHMPDRIAAMPTPTVGAASLLSVLAHVAALSLILWHTTREADTASVGQRKGAISFRLAQLSQPRIVAPPAPPLTPPSTRAAIHHTPEPALPHEVAIAPEPSPQDPPASAEVPPPQTTPESNPGATFANLFAPLINRPMGRGHWGSPPPRPEPLNDPTIQLQTQALQTRQALQERVQQLQAHLQDTPVQGSCQVTLDLTKRWAHVQCPRDSDAAVIWSYLNGAMVEGLIEPSPYVSCLQIANSNATWDATCP